MQDKIIILKILKNMAKLNIWKQQKIGISIMKELRTDEI
jgi:hypothetical protein